MIVADTSLLLCLWVPSERSDVSEKVYHCDPVWIAPASWREEFRDHLVHHMRQGVPLELVKTAMTQAEDLMSAHEYDVDSFDILQLSAVSGCSARDSAFVRVAQVKGVPLVTFDPEIATRFPGIAIHPQDFVRKFT